VFVALGNQHAMRMGHIGVCGLSGCTIFFHIISRFGKILEKKMAEHKMCVLIFSATFI